MIIVTSHDNCYTFKRFLKYWGPSLRGKIRFIYYADLAHYKALPRDVYIFTDLERLTPTQVELAAEAAQQLRVAGVTILNEPSRVLRRYDLQRALYADGINTFRMYRLVEERSQLRYPVFLRLEREHQGNLSPLLYNAAELDAAIEKATHSGLTPEDLLIVEYCDVSKAGGAQVFAKFDLRKPQPHIGIELACGFVFVT